MKLTASRSIYLLRNRPETLPVVASWIYREWSFLYEGETIGYVEEMLRARLHIRKLPITLVAMAGEKPVGTVSLKKFELPERPDLTPWVASLYVVPKARKRGTGSELMRAAERKARSMGIEKLFLFTADRSLASRFYPRLGWTVRERILFDSYPVIVMHKNLTRR